MAEESRKGRAEPKLQVSLVMRVSSLLLPILSTSIAALAATACASTAGDENVRGASSELDGVAKQGEHEFDHVLPTGNGRSCTTCHVEDDGFTLSPAHVEAHYAALPRDADGTVHFDSDPLFQSLDADDSDHDFTRLRQGLARVTIPLPPNVTIDELPGATQIGLFRAVPSIFNVAFTAPYLQDGRASTLEDQALGAANGHIQVREQPDADFLHAIASYEKTEFSSPLVEAMAARLAAGETNVPRAEPSDLTSEEEDGKARFNFRCSSCHGSATLQHGRAADINPWRSVSVSELNKVSLPVYTFRVHNADGSVSVVRSPDPGRMLIDGNAANANAFDIPSLYGLNKTAPYFHDNSATTLEDVMQQYVDDFASIRAAAAAGAPIPPPVLAQVQPMSDDDIRLIILYLRRLP
jgi:cytochrome c peroxidase